MINYTSEKYEFYQLIRKELKYITMKGKILKKKTIIEKIMQGIDNNNWSLVSGCNGRSKSDMVKPLIEYIEKMTDVEVE